jgi:hypothetical protein
VISVLIPYSDSEDETDLPAVILRCNGTFAGHNDTVWCLHALDDVLLSGSSDKTVKVRRTVDALVGMTISDVV